MVLSLQWKRLLMPAYPKPSHGKLMKPRQELTIVVPLEPPTVNMYVRHTRAGRHYVTAEAKAYLEAVAIFARGRSVAGKAYRVSFIVYQGKGSKGDVDNYAKCVLDGLARAGVIHSDAAVNLLTIAKARDWDNPRTEITVSVLT